MYEEYGYLIHSSKGSTWSKRSHKYIDRIWKNGRWRYVYKQASSNPKVTNLKTKINRKIKGMSPEDVSFKNGSYTIGIKDNGKANSRSQTIYGNQSWDKSFVRNHDIGGLSREAAQKNPSNSRAFEETYRNYYKDFDGNYHYMPRKKNR